MAGCFGNHPYDRYLEGQLNDYLETLEDNPFKISGTITYIKNKLVIVAPVSEEIETRYESDNEVTEEYIATFCRDNDLSIDQVVDYDIDLVYMGDKRDE